MNPSLPPIVYEDAHVYLLGFSQAVSGVQVPAQCYFHYLLLVDIGEYSNRELLAGFIYHIGAERSTGTTFYVQPEYRRFRREKPSFCRDLGRIRNIGFHQPEIWSAQLSSAFREWYQEFHTSRGGPAWTSDVNCQTFCR